METLTKIQIHPQTCREVFHDYGILFTWAAHQVTIGKDKQPRIRVLVVDVVKSLSYWKINLDCDRYDLKYRIPVNWYMVGNG